MKTELVEIKSKGEVVGSKEYSYPENLKEALQVDGEESVYKLYAQQRRIRFADTERRALTGGGGLPKHIREALKNADPKMMEKIQKLLGLDVA